LQAQYQELKEKIDYLESVLEDEDLRMTIIKDELNEVKDKFGDDRRTEITYADGEITIEDLIANDDMVITITNQGYIKRTNASEYQAQGRGGVGSKGTGRKDADFVEHLFIARTHNYLLFFTEKGKCYWLKVYAIPSGERSHRGRAIQNLISIDRDDSIKAFITVENFDDKDFVDSHYIMMATRKGQVKKTSLRDYSRPRTNGIIAINIAEGDELIEAKLTNGESQIVMAVKSGYAVRFEEEKVRVMGRNAMGVRGISLQDEADEVVGMVVVPNDEKKILVVSEKGFGKKTALSEYRLTNRGVKGVKTMNVAEKTGGVSAIKQVEDTEDEDLMIITRNGITIRMKVADISTLSRNTMGVKLISIRDGDAIASVAKVVEREDDEEEIEESKE
ncbi:MAG: DNA gyrase C-terminal beta-propeller domain-containing protein, partial [Bacteroidota bacterium]